MAKDPESLGTGIGALLADYLPLMPSGARRSGAARVMAARIGQDPSFLVEHPIKTQLAAMGIGGLGATYADQLSTPYRSLIGVAPWLVVQALRRREIKGIQSDYDEQKRKRLRELDEEALFDPGILGLGGSSRLGATQAYETMRKRKYQDLSSLAETSDVAQMLANSVGLGVPATAVLGGLDNVEARRLRKQADFSEQRNTPAIPLYMLAGLLSSLGSRSAAAWFHNRWNKADPLPTSEWSDLVRHTSKANPLVYSARGMRNAFHGKPRDAASGDMLLRYLDQFNNVEHEPSTWARRRFDPEARRDRLRRLLRYGVVMSGEDASASVLAHEGGHSRIEETPGVLRALQRHVYPYSKLIAPISGVGSMAAGLASGGPIRGALLGTGIGLLTGAGTVGPEIGASLYGRQGLRTHQGGALSNPKHNKELMAALSTYLAGGVLPSTLAGAAGGYISGRRNKKRGQEKEASMAKLWPTIRRIRELRSLGPDAAFRHSIDTIGKSDVVAEKMFFSAPEIKSLGITKRTPDKTIAQLIKQLSEPKAPPRNWTVPQRPGAQGTLDLFKRAVEHPELQTMIQAKAHSDEKRYVDKNRLIAQAMRRDPAAFIIDSDDGKGIVGVTHVPTGFRIHMLKSQVDPGVQPPVGAPAGVVKAAVAGEAMTGAALGAALPAASLLDYEMRLRPGYRRQIIDLVDDAVRQKKLFASPVGFDDFKNPLQSRMRFGDILAQSHGAARSKGIRNILSPDFTVMSMGGSGSPFAHIATTTGGGRAVHAGSDLTSPFSVYSDRIMGELRKGPRKWNLREALLNARKDVAGIKMPKPFRGGVEAIGKQLHSLADDAFDSSSSRPNVTVVRRHSQLGKQSPAQLQQLQEMILRNTEKGYDKGMAVKGGLRRLMLPFVDKLQRSTAKATPQCVGTHCTAGVGDMLKRIGVATPTPKNLLPPDLLNMKGMETVGIGVNRAAMDAHAPALKGLRGSARRAGATKLELLKNLGTASKWRRGFGGGLMALLGLGGAGVGALAGKLRDKSAES